MPDIFHKEFPTLTAQELREALKRTDEQLRLSRGNGVEDSWIMETVEYRDALEAELKLRVNGNDILQAGDDFHNTDMGNASRFAAMHSKDVKYSKHLGWFCWDGKRFLRDETDDIERRARDTVRSIYLEAAQAEEKDKRQALGDWAFKCESAQKIKPMIWLAQSEENIAVRADIFDRDPLLFNVANGTLDLRTGKLRDHRREDLITKVSPVIYDPEASCVTWLKFLERVLNDDPMLLEFVQSAMGYLLTGDTSEQCFFLGWGSGANGKTTFINILLDLLGDYALQSPMETFFVKKTGAIPNDIARMKGARLVVATEGEAGRRLAESLVKQLTGQDRISARFLHREYFEFNPSFKLWLSTNHKPRIIGNDHAMWRRVRLVPFTVTIPDKDQDKELPEKLRRELPGILSWAVEGVRKYLQSKSLPDSPAIRVATEEYREEMDTVGNFIAERCVVSQEVKGTAKDLYREYSEWAEGNGEKPMSQTRFGLALGERSFIKQPTKTGITWKGIALRVNGE